MEIIFFVFVYNDDDDAAIFNKLSNFTKFFKIIMSFFMSHSCCTQYDAYCYNSKKIIQKNHYDRTDLDHKFDTKQFFHQKIAHPVHF